MLTSRSRALVEVSCHMVYLFSTILTEFLPIPIDSRSCAGKVSKSATTSIVEAASAASLITTAHLRTTTCNAFRLTILTLAMEYAADVS